MSANECYIIAYYYYYYENVMGIKYVRYFVYNNSI